MSRPVKQGRRRLTHPDVESFLRKPEGSGSDETEIKRDHDLCYLITPLAFDFPVSEEADYIGVDAGFEKIMQAGIPLKLAVGDFDSLESSGIPEDALILPMAKDETDSEMAMRTAVAMGYSRIILWGGLSGRLDHTLANLRLMAWQYPQVILMDSKQKAMTLLPGIYRIPAEYPHLSLFALETSVISESGVVYPLNHERITVQDIFTTSNQFASGEAEIEVHSGRVLCVLSGYR